MKRQTFIIEINPEQRFANNRTWDFWRVGCKRESTALKYLRNWIKEAKDRGLEHLYSGFFVKNATYRITATPADGAEHIVMQGKISEIIKHI